MDDCFAQSCHGIISSQLRTINARDTEIRRLRAMVLRAHARQLEGPWGDTLFSPNNHLARNWVNKKNPGEDSEIPPGQFRYASDRAARLLNHYANGIESGRIK